MTCPKTCFAWLALCLLPAMAWAQEDPGGLLQRIRAARESFRPLDAQSLEHRRGALLRSLGELDQLLTRSRPGYAQGWKEYFRWDELNENIRDEEVDVAELRSTLGRFRQNHRGLEMPRFVAVRERLAEYIEALTASREENMQEDYLAAMDDLARRIEEYEGSPSGLNGPEIARTLSWLQGSGQAADLVPVVQARYARPNIFAQGSERLLAIGFNNYVDRVSPVRDNILGTDIHGTARFRGTQMLDTVPSRNDGRLNILLRGNIHSNNLGYNGPVTIRSTAVTSVNATKQLVVNENGIYALGAGAACRTSTNIHSISAKCGLIERIAWKRAGKQKGAAEAVGSRHAEARIRGNMNGEAGGQLARANAAFQEKFRQPLLRRGHAPRHMQVSSGNYGLAVAMLQMANTQLGAPSEPPPHQQSHDIAVRAHESAVSNFSEAIIGGVELTDEKLAEMLKDATGEVPEELQITEDKDPWSITFADHYPIAATFHGNQARLYLRANRFTRGRNEDGSVDQDVRGLVQISAVYNIEHDGSRARLIRDGDVNVDFVGQDKLSTAQITTKTFLRRKFESLFKEEFAGEGLRLKGRFERAGTLALREVKADQGWISVGWQMQ